MQVVPNGGSGVALAEIYDAEPSTGTPLINISTRGYVGSGEAGLTAGFVVAGDTPKRLLIRGVGPGLTAYGVAGALENPVLKVYQGSNVVAQNDDWQSAGENELASASAAVGAFALAKGSRDAAVIVTLAPGAYSGVVSPTGDASGAALVEVYELPVGQ